MLLPLKWTWTHALPNVLVHIKFVVMVLETKLIVQFSLKSVKDPVQVVALTKGSPDAL